MVPEFHKQSSKNIESLGETIVRLVNSLPYQVRELHPDMSSKKVLNILQHTKIPGLVALPFLEHKKFSFDAAEEALAENVLFQEDFSSPENLYKAIDCMIISKRFDTNQILPTKIQDLIIAGLFGMTYCSFPFPLKTLREASEALYILTKEQACIVASQNRQRNCITGPAGTGKTWMLIVSVKKTYDAIKERKKGKGNILVLTYNKPILKFIEDTTTKLIEDTRPLAVPAPSHISQADCKQSQGKTSKGKSERSVISYYTIDGLKEHLKKEMIGKAKASSTHSINRKISYEAQSTFLRNTTRLGMRRRRLQVLACLLTVVFHQLRWRMILKPLKRKRTRIQIQKRK